MCRGKAFANLFFVTALTFVVCHLLWGQHEVAAASNRTLFLEPLQGSPIYHIREPLPHPAHKCSPGKTYIANFEKKIDLDLIRPFARQLNELIDFSPCFVCICSWDGMREHCFNRTGNTTNECVRMAILAQSKYKERPHNQWTSLFNRIRKDDIICCNHDATRKKNLHDKIKLRVKKELDLNAIKVEDLLKQEPEIKQNKRFSGNNDYVDFIVNNDK